MLSRKKAVVDTLYKFAAAQDLSQHAMYGGGGALAGSLAGALLGNKDDLATNALLGALAGGGIGAGYSALKPQVDSALGATFTTEDRSNLANLLGFGALGTAGGYAADRLSSVGSSPGSFASLSSGDKGLLDALIGGDTADVSKVDPDLAAALKAYREGHIASLNPNDVGQIENIINHHLTDPAIRSKILNEVHQLAANRSKPTGRIGEHTRALNEIITKLQAEQTSRASAAVAAPFGNKVNPMEMARRLLAQDASSVPLVGKPLNAVTSYLGGANPLTNRVTRDIMRDGKFDEIVDNVMSSRGIKGYDKGGLAKKLLENSEGLGGLKGLRRNLGRGAITGLAGAGLAAAENALVG